MSNITIGQREICDYTDRDLANWMNDATNGYKLRDKTCQLWIEIVRAFDEAEPPMTVRQVFYALVSRGAIPKTEAAYNQTCYHLLQMRRRDLIPYDFISDNTRWMRKPKSYDSLDAFLGISQDAYRRALWANQDAYVEIWIEKDALAGVAYEVTEKWDVPLMVTRGFPSETFVYNAAEAIKASNKVAFLYYFGDHDPSGVAIPKNTQEKLYEFGAECSFEVMAVLPWQITEWNLPTRPTKRTDTRAKDWQGGSVELDAIPVNRLRKMIEYVITRHINRQALEDNQRVERLERETLEQIVNNFRLARNSQEAA
jgi:hypothetical protein